MLMQVNVDRCTGKDWVVPGDWSLDAAPKGY